MLLELVYYLEDHCAPTNYSGCLSLAFIFSTGNMESLGWIHREPFQHCDSVYFVLSPKSPGPAAVFSLGGRAWV